MGAAVGVSLRCSFIINVLVKIKSGDPQLIDPNECKCLFVSACFHVVLNVGVLCSAPLASTAIGLSLFSSE